MADPNIASSTATLYKKSVGAALTTTLTGTIVANASGSGVVIEVFSAYVANIDGANSVDITMDVRKNSGTAYKIANTVPLSADSTEVMITKDAPIVLQEGDSLRGGASANSDAEAVVSYNEYAAS